MRSDHHICPPQACVLSKKLVAADSGMQRGGQGFHPTLLFLQQNLLSVCTPIVTLAREVRKDLTLRLCSSSWRRAEAECKRRDVQAQEQQLLR